jgi:hypothetical protein
MVNSTSLSGYQILFFIDHEAFVAEANSQFDRDLY